MTRINEYRMRWSEIRDQIGGLESLIDSETDTAMLSGNLQVVNSVINQLERLMIRAVGSSILNNKEGVKV